MNPLTFPGYLTKGERSQKVLLGYPVEIAKYIPKSKPPPDGRNGAADRFEVSGRTNSGLETITP